MKIWKYEKTADELRSLLIAFCPPIHVFFTSRLLCKLCSGKTGSFKNRCWIVIFVWQFAPLRSNVYYWTVISCGAVYYAVQGGSSFWVCGWNPKVWPFKWKLLSSTFQGHFNFWVCGWNPYVLPFERKLLSSTFLWCCLLCCSRWF